MKKRLVIASGILLLLAALFCPNPYWRRLPRAANCLSGVKQITLAMLMYAQDHGGRLPEAEGLWEVLLPKYHPYKFLFVCPGARDKAQPSYAMVPMYSGADLSAIPEPESAIVLYEVADGVPAYRHGRPNPPVRGSVYALIREKLTKPGTNVGFADGHARWSNRITPEMLAHGRDFDVARKLARSRFRGR